MLTQCLKSQKNTESENPKTEKTKSERIMLLSKCAVCNIKKSKFIKQQEEASRLLSGLVIKTALSKIPLIGPVLIVNPCI